MFLIKNTNTEQYLGKTFNEVNDGDGHTSVWFDDSWETLESFKELSYGDRTNIYIIYSLEEAKKIKKKLNCCISKLLCFIPLHRFRN